MYANYIDFILAAHFIMMNAVLNILKCHITSLTGPSEAKGVDHGGDKGCWTPPNILLGEISLQKHPQYLAGCVMISPEYGKHIKIVNSYSFRSFPSEENRTNLVFFIA